MPYNNKPLAGYKLEGSVDHEIIDKILEKLKSFGSKLRHPDKKDSFADTEWVLFPAFYRHSKYKDILTKEHMSSFKEMLDVCLPIIEKIENMYPEFMVFYTEINTIPPGVNVRRHTDNRWFLDNAKRMHVVLKTNDQCFFTVNDKETKFNKGELFEFNNNLPHSVHNTSQTESRTHIVIDLIYKDDFEMFDERYKKESQSHISFWEHGRPDLPDRIKYNML